MSTQDSTRSRPGMSADWISIWVQRALALLSTITVDTWGAGGLKVELFEGTLYANAMITHSRQDNGAGA